MIKHILPAMKKIIVIYGVCLLFYIVSCLISDKPLKIYWLDELVLFIITLFIFTIETLWQKRKKKKL